MDRWSTRWSDYPATVRSVAGGSLVSDLDWDSVVRDLFDRGWTRIEQAADESTLAGIEQAAAGPWLRQDDGDVRVHQGGLGCHSSVADAAPPVPTLAEEITRSVDVAGDLVLMQSGGWPRPDDRCPIHAVDSPPSGSRLTLTLRHNKGGYGADYFT